MKITTHLTPIRRSYIQPGSFAGGRSGIIRNNNSQQEIGPDIRRRCRDCHLRLVRPRKIHPIELPLKRHRTRPRCSNPKARGSSDRHRPVPRLAHSFNLRSLRMGSIRRSELKRLPIWIAAAHPNHKLSSSLHRPIPNRIQNRRLVSQQERINATRMTCREKQRQPKYPPVGRPFHK
ncbi:MAG: hypothetical protein BWY82_02655 [Verrucomicrobia bacterium ADurb.Bin474]|nr:MAG: hypothetical protein BWY82_02655 [Verrucomicrobia bacterium ADurb.Bin474]